MKKRIGLEYEGLPTDTHACNIAFVINEKAFYIIEPQTDEVVFLCHADLGI